MARTSNAAVQAILVSGKNYDGSTDLTPFVDTATVMVDEVVTMAAAKGLALAAALLERIECYLAAHFYALADPLYQSKTTGKSSATYQGQTGMGWDATTYGQQAKRMDISGSLARMDRTQHQVGMAWLGKRPSEQLTAEERD